MAISPSRQRPACAALAEHHTKIEDRHVRELFAAHCDLEERRVMMLAGKPTTFPARSSLN
jgi:hypothetical protein